MIVNISIVDVSIVSDQFSKRYKGISFPLEILNNGRESTQCIFPDIMQENDASRFGLSHDIFCEFFWIFLFPIIRIDIPSDDRTMMKPFYPTVLIPIREAKKDRITFRCRPNHETCTPDFEDISKSRNPREARMDIAMIPDFISCFCHASEDFLVFHDSIPEDEEGRRNTVYLENIENLRSIESIGPIIEGESNYFS